MKSLEEVHDAYYEEARQELLDGLARCTEANHRMFRLMYANGNMQWSLEKVVKAMPTIGLKRALEQVQATIDRQED